MSNNLNETEIVLNAENLVSALCCISGIQKTVVTTQSSQTTSSAVKPIDRLILISPETIKRAENALLYWEQSNPSTYAICLIGVMIQPLHTDEHLNVNMGTGSIGTATNASACEIPRLAAALSLKALVSRKWKDRGRLSKKKAVVLLDNEIKQCIRGVVLNLITSTATTSCTFDGPNNYTIDGQVSVAFARHKPLMTALSSIVSKIGSYDLPLGFKELIPTLVGYSTGEYAPMDTSITAEVRLNTANALEFILADICAKRLLVYKKYILSIASTHLEGLVNGFKFAMNHLKTSDAKTLPLILSYALAMAKTLNHLLLSSMSSFTNSVSTNANQNNNYHDMDKSSGNGKLAVIDQVFELLLEYIPLLCNYLYKRDGSNDNNNNNNGGIGKNFNDDLMEQLKNLLAELHSMVVLNQKAHPLAFTRYLPHFLTFFTKDLEMMIASNDCDSEAFWVVPRMSFISNVISCSSYSPDESNNESIETWSYELKKKGNTRHAISSKGDISIDPSSISVAINHVWSEYLSVEQINKLVEISLHFMTLNESMLIEWSNDPELFFIERRNANADEDPIACAQNLYLSLLESECREIVIGTIGTFLFRVDEQIEAIKVEVERSLKQTGYESVVYWDSVYTALGLSFNVLKQSLNFDINNWLTSCLSQILQILTISVGNKPNRLPILRSRLLWLCGFSNLNQNQDAIQVFFPLLQNNLNSENDPVVQLSAVQALTNIIVDPPVNFASLLHLSEELIALLYTLTLKFEEFESKSDCLSLIQLLITTCYNCGLKINNQQQVAAFINPLESIWNSSQQNEFFMLRNFVLSILRSIAAFGQVTMTGMYPMVFPLLNHALDSNIDENQHLVSDSLDLLLTLLRVASSYELSFSAMFNRVHEILGKSFEHLKKLMLITEGFLILGGDSFIQEHSSSIVKVFQLTLGEVNPRGMAYVNLVFEALLIQNPATGGSMLFSSGLIAKMVESCAATYRNENLSESMQVIEIYLTVFARILLALPNEIPTFLHHLEYASFRLGHLVELYFMQVESSGALRQKLWVMFLLSLLVPTGLGHIPDGIMLTNMNFNKVLQLSLSVLQENCGMSPYEIEAFYESEEDSLDLHKDQYDRLSQDLSKQDICIRTNFWVIYSNTMQQLQKALIGSKYQQVLQNVDQELVGQINEIRSKGE